ncbi:unnamed protein product [Rhizophagus irregularis]|nr:unnamed protein product [Rhizophagus irregularis]
MKISCTTATSTSTSPTTSTTTSSAISTQQQSIYKLQSQYYPEFGRNYRPFRLQYLMRMNNYSFTILPGVHILKRRQQSQSTRQAESLIWKRSNDADMKNFSRLMEASTQLL